MINKSAEIRTGITKGIVVFVLSLFLFASVDINFRIYAVALISVSILVPLNFWKNRSVIYPKVALLVTANLVAYGAIFHFMRRDLYSISMIDVFLNVAVILIPIILCCLCLDRDDKDVADKRGYHDLFPEQVYDLERLGHFVEAFEITGINSAWGTGKTFLMKKFVDDNMDKYVFIRIDLLSCNLDEIQNLLIDEMERVLLANRIYSRYSKKLKRMMDKSDVFSKIPNILSDDAPTYAVALEEFKNELKLVGKPIVIIYEDIDRIESEDIIKKVFSISEQLASDWIKIVYQYDQVNFDKIGLERTFTEKYIPYTFGLTELEFRDIMQFLYDAYKIDDKLIVKEDFDKLVYEMERREIRGFDFQTARFEIDLPFSNVTIRGVKNFLLELQSALKGSNGEEYLKKGNKETVLAFFFCKAFFI